MINIVSLRIPNGPSTMASWDSATALINRARPDIVMLQNVGFLKSAPRLREAEKQLNLSISLGPSHHRTTGLGWRASRFTRDSTDVDYSHEVLHGYAAVRLAGTGDAALPSPLGAISVDLTHFGARAAAQEIQLIGVRALLSGGLGIIAGHLPYVPLGDPEPDWTRSSPGQRLAGCLPRTRPDEPPVADRIVGATLAAGDFVDVAAHLADRHHDPSYRQVVGPALIRTYQAHTTPALAPAIADFTWLPQLATGQRTGFTCRLNPFCLHRRSPGNQPPTGKTSAQAPARQ